MTHTRHTHTHRTFSSTVNVIPPWEDMVLLANAVGADAWINIPHRASKDYIFNLATLLKTKLRPDLNVYIEWANEVWHNGFAGGQYAQTEGLR
jgi:hypothetical protein